MDLILSVIRYQSRPSQQAQTARISTTGGTIGRQSGNDLVLPDPERWVGRQHARINFRDGTFYLTDTSKNGTLINNAANPLREGQEVELHDGDELGIGAYTIQISLEVAQSQPVASVDPFASGEPEPVPQTPSDHTTPDILDLVGAGPAGLEPSSPLAAEQDAPAVLDDWLAAESPRKEPWVLGTEREPPEAPASPTEPDHTPNENAFFSPPDAIPENYDIWADESHPQPNGGGPSISAPEFPASPAPATPPPEEQRSPPPPQSGATPERRPPPNREDDTDALQAFLTGLGTGELPADPQAQVRLMQATGLLLRAMTEGLMRVLLGRTSFKSELRLQMTAIQSTRNNPFKFSVDPENALAHLLFRPSRGFLRPVEAAHEAFDDIQCHEMAIIAGLRAALRALLARMDPAQLEKRFSDRSVIDNLMPMARKAKYWDLFTETYKEISADAADDFLRLFNDEFTRAYEDQASRLRQVKPRDRPPPDEH